MIKITKLVDNDADQPFRGEWGLSLLIEAYGKRFVFDTGNSDRAVNNAGLLGINLTELDGIFLSHGHRDHTCGLLPMLQSAGSQTIYVHPTIWQKRFSIKTDSAPPQQLGIPYTMQEVETNGGQLRYIDRTVFINDNIFVITNIPMNSELEKLESNLIIKNNEMFQVDSFTDEIALVINSKLGLIVISGCAHRGIINTLHEACAISGISKTYAVIGGAHLYQAPQERISYTAQRLHELGV